MSNETENQETQEQYCKVPVSKLAHLIDTCRKLAALEARNVESWSEYEKAMDIHHKWRSPLTDIFNLARTNRNIVRDHGFTVEEQSCNVTRIVRSGCSDHESTSKDNKEHLALVPVSTLARLLNESKDYDGVLNFLLSIGQFKQWYTETVERARIEMDILQVKNAGFEIVEKEQQ